MADSVQVETKEERETTAPQENRAAGYFRARPRAKWFLLFVGVAAVAAGVWTWQYLAVRETTDDAQIDGYINPVSARVAGYVTRVNVEDNQYVEAGTVLAQIDPKDYEVALQRAKAELADAEATAKTAQIGVPITSINTASTLSTTEADVSSARAGEAASQRQLEAAQARLREAEANSAKARADLARYQQLVGKDEISQQQYDQAVAASKASEAAVDAARAQVSAAQEHIAQATSRQRHAEATVKAAQTGPQQVALMNSRARAAEAAVLKDQAAVAQAQLNLQYTIIVAPVSGIVGQRSVQVGQNVQAGQPLMAIVPVEKVWVTANFKETQLKNMRPGQPAVITVDAYGGRKYRGHVESIAGATGSKFSLLPPENATGNYVKVVQRVPVRIVIEKGQDSEHLLRPGMSVISTVLTRKAGP